MSQKNKNISDFQASGPYNWPRAVCKQGEEEKAWKRRLQSRINQRARRARIKNNSSVTKPCQIQIHRWRIEEHNGDPSLIQSIAAPIESQLSGTHGSQLSQTLFPISIPDFSEEQMYHLSLSSSLKASHLLHLIHFNVIRGLTMIKSTLNASAVNISQHSKIPIPIHSDESFRGSFVIKPTFAHRVPSDLMPTYTQLTVSHATWTNFIPFPQIRDNLIKWQDRFSHREFVQDLFGTELLAAQWFRERKSSKEIPQRAKKLVVGSSPFSNEEDDIDDEVTADRQSLILWGEPHLKESWEATPGFLRKWVWVVDGCEEFIRSTNHWRKERGEEELRLECVK